MQQVAAGQIVGLAQVQVQRLLLCLGFQTQALLCLLQVALQRHGGHVGRYLPETVPHDEGVGDKTQHGIVA